MSAARPDPARARRAADRAVEPLRAAHAREFEALTAAAKEMGERGLPGRKEIVDQHHREERRFRTDALRAGLGVLARAYRAPGASGRPAVPVAVRRPGRRAAPPTAVGLITEAAAGPAPQPERGPAAAVAPGPAGTPGRLISSSGSQHAAHP